MTCHISSKENVAALIFTYAEFLTGKMRVCYICDADIGILGCEKMDKDRSFPKSCFSWRQSSFLYLIDFVFVHFIRICV